ncbi:hypothetical protein [Inquilinus sp. OTU3971]|uniref:hypothetical protein n=1 Tax=Inquilinus sp. OTU3971 TaxID=3043855 RepID=UPI00313D5C00
MLWRGHAGVRMQGFCDPTSEKALPMSPFKSPMIVLGLGLLCTACADRLPDPKPFSRFGKGPEATGTVPATPVAVTTLPLEVIARKAQSSRVTLDRAMDTMQQRLSTLKKLVIEARANLGPNGTPAQYAALRQAERQVRRGMVQARISTGDQTTGWTEQASTINDLSGLIVSVSGLVNTIGDGQPVPATQTGEAMPSNVGGTGVFEPAPAVPVAAPAAPAGPVTAAGAS